MNERIQKLINQTGVPVSIPFDAWCEKFAELIVQECTRIAELKEQGYNIYDSNTSVGWYIRQHFGIK